MVSTPQAYQALPLGVVLRRAPGVTRWAAWSWRLRAVLPGAPQADWVEMRRDGDATEFHAATVALELFGADSESYLHGLRAREPSVYVVMRPTHGPHPLQVLLATVSPYEAQDYADNGDDIVEKIAMPPALREFVEGFVARHHQETPFKKRKRDKQRVDLAQDGIGDARIAKAADVYASPASLKARL